MSDALMIYPDRFNFLIRLGILSLCGWATNQSFSHSSGKVSPVNASLLSGYFLEQHLIASSSFKIQSWSSYFWPIFFFVAEKTWYVKNSETGCRCKLPKHSTSYFNLFDISIRANYDASYVLFVLLVEIWVKENSLINNPISLLINYLAAPNNIHAAITKKNSSHI